MSLTNNVDVDILQPITETQYNYARINAFKLVALDIPGVDFYCQAMMMPSAQMNATASLPNPLNPYPLTGTRIEYGDLQITFLVDEQFNNYRSVYDWMVGIAFPQSHDQFGKTVADRRFRMGGSKNVESTLRSELHLIMLDSMNQPIVKYVFFDAFPVSVEALPFDVTITDAQFFSVMAAFRFSYYLIEPV